MCLGNSKIFEDEIAQRREAQRETLNFRRRHAPIPRFTRIFNPKMDSIIWRYHGTYVLMLNGVEAQRKILGEIQEDMGAFLEQLQTKYHLGRGEIDQIPEKILNNEVVTNYLLNLSGRYPNDADKPLFECMTAYIECMKQEQSYITALYNLSEELDRFVKSLPVAMKVGRMVDSAKVSALYLEAKNEKELKGQEVPQ